MPPAASRSTRVFHVSFRDETGALKQALLRDVHPLVWAVHGWVANGHGPRTASIVSWTEVEPGDAASAALVVRHASGESGMPALTLQGLIHTAEARIPRARNAAIEACLSVALQGLRAYAAERGDVPGAVAA